LLPEAAPVPPDPRQQLEEQLFAVRSLGQADLRTRLAWLEATVLAADAVDLDDEGRAGARHLRAALGAIVRWSQGDRDPATLVELDAVVRTLLARGTVGLLRSLAAGYAALVKARAPHRGSCAEARDALLALARSVEQGRPPPPAVAARLAAIRATLPHR
jgi:hypothetical protein